MIIDMRLNPQSQKERSIKDVFQRMGLDPKWQDQIMNDFFRAEPAGLGDIGYWNGRFYIKDITLPEFMAEQIASRVKMEFREDKDLSGAFLLKSVKGEYHSGADSTYFKVDLFVEGRDYGAAEPGRLYDGALKAALKVAADVIHGYMFRGFSYIEIANQSDGKILRVSGDSLEKYRAKKLKFEEIGS